MNFLLLKLPFSLFLLPPNVNTFFVFCFLFFVFCFLFFVFRIDLLELHWDFFFSLWSISSLLSEQQQTTTTNNNQITHELWTVVETTTITNTQILLLFSWTRVYIQLVFNCNFKKDTKHFDGFICCFLVDFKE